MKRVILFLLIVGLAASVANATMLKGPYMIYPGVNTEMMVLWQLDSTQTCTIEWGTSTSYGNSVQTTESGDHQHEKIITGLTPGQKYYYRVNDGAYHTGSFYAAPSTSATSVKFLAFGDCRTNTATFDTVATKMIAAYQADEGYQTFTMLSGDWVNSGKTDAEWQDQFFNRSYTNITEMQANLPINGVIGNHEQLSSEGDDGDMFLKYWPYPYVDASWGSFWTDTTHFWSFDYGPVHFTMIDQYDASYGLISQSQLDWLASDLAATDRTFKIIQLHEPGWSSDGQGAHTDAAQVQESIQPLCLAYGVDMLISGHNHYYTRCEVSEVVHITTGGAGPSLDTPDPDHTPYVALVSKTNHFMKLSANATTEEIDVVVEDVDGNVVDSFTIDHDYTVMLPWSDGFESGDFAGGGWIDSGRYCTISTDSYAGTYAAEIEKDNYIVKSVSTAGMSDIHVKYAAKTLDLDAGEYLYVEWSADGSNWNQLEATQATSYAYSDKTCASGADDKRGFMIRFRSNAGVKEKVFVDSVEVTGTAGGGEPDTTAPTPDPMTFATAPYATGETSIAMVATTASDSSGVEYFFDCTAGGGNDSIWQDSASYEDTGLTASTQYTYTVTARDKSANQNATAASSGQSATTDSPDTTAPTPSPMTWATVPYSTGSSSIAMVATTATDASGVEYFFTCTAGGGNDSIWQDNTDYEDTGLSENTQYTYTVIARDKSVAQNSTTVSSAQSATTDAGSPEVYVYDIAMSSYESKTGYYAALATVWIKDTSTNDIDGATVTGGWSGATVKGDGVGVTGGDGKITLESDGVKGGGTYTFTVTGVSASGYTYNASLNNEDSDQVTAP